MKAQTEAGDAQEDSEAEDEPDNDEEDGTYKRQDAIGRWYRYDHHGNRIFAKTLHGSFRPHPFLLVNGVR